MTRWELIVLILVVLAIGLGAVVTLSFREHGLSCKCRGCFDRRVARARQAGDDR